MSSSVCTTKFNIKTSVQRNKGGTSKKQSVTDGRKNDLDRISNIDNIYNY